MIFLSKISVYLVILRGVNAPFSAFTQVKKYVSTIICSQYRKLFVRFL